MRSVKQVVTVAALVLAVVLGAGAPALAHNRLTSSDPEDGATLAEGPDEVRLAFLARLDPQGSSVAVAGPDGATAVAGEPDFDGSSVTVAVRTAQAGEYEVSYEVLSTDGHLVDGTVSFTVTAGEQPSPSPSPSPAAPPPATPPAAASPVAASPVASADGGGLPWWLWLLAAFLLAAGGYGGFRLVRRAH